MAVLLAATTALSSCATTPQVSAGRDGRPSVDCALIAEIARVQYGYDSTMTLLLNREGYVPVCDWQALGLEVEGIDPELLDTLTPWLRFQRPRRSGGQRIVVVTHWMGVHFYERRCRLRPEGDHWRLAEACSPTWSF